MPKTYTFMEAFELCRDRGWEFYLPDTDGKMYRSSGGDPWLCTKAKGPGEPFTPYLIVRNDWTRVEPVRRLHYTKADLNSHLSGHNAGEGFRHACRDLLLLHEIAEKANEYNNAGNSEDALRIGDELRELLKCVPTEEKKPPPPLDIDAAHDLQPRVQGQDLFYRCETCDMEFWDTGANERCMGEVRGDD